MNYFDEIYRLAKQGDEPALQNLLPNACIDESKQGNPYITAAFKLAAENNQQAVNLLRKFHAHLVPITRGAAMGGHFTYVNELLDKGANIDDVVFGATWGRHYTYVKELIDKGADIYPAIRGAIMGGDFIKVNELRGEMKKKNTPQVEAAERQLTEDLAMCGYCIDENTNFLYSKYFADNIAGGAAIGGHCDYAEKYRHTYSSHLKTAYAAALGGNRDYAAKILEKHPHCIDVIAKGAALGGHRADAEEFRMKGADIIQIMEGAIQGGHLSYAQFLRSLLPKFVLTAAPSSNPGLAKPAVAPSLPVNFISPVKTVTPQGMARIDIEKLKGVLSASLLQQIQEIEQKNLLLEKALAEQEQINKQLAIEKSELAKNNVVLRTKLQDCLAEKMQQNQQWEDEKKTIQEKLNSQQELIDLQKLIDLQRKLLHHPQQLTTSSVIRAHSSTSAATASSFFHPVTSSSSPIILPANGNSCLLANKNENEGTYQDSNTESRHLTTLSFSAVKREEEDKGFETPIAKRPRGDG